MQIRELRGPAELAACVELLRRAFATVAEEFGLTPANAPTNAAFTTEDNLRRHLEDGMVLHGLLLDGSLAGCVAIKKSRGTEGVFYVERLAVDPACRGRGHGARLMAFAMEEIRLRGGTAASVGLIDANERLKAWYRGMGFVSHDRRRIAGLPFKVCFMSRELAGGKRYESILFDLDGTLVDPREGITGSVQYALGKLGVTVEAADSLTPYIGPPLRAAFQEIHGLSPGQAEEAVSHYRVRYELKGIFENRPYPGTREMLDLLVQRGKRLFLATSKPWVYARRIVQHSGLEPFFASVEGCELDGTRSDKAELLAHILATHRLSRESTVMVGDRMHDVAAASKNGMDSVAVGYGYGSREELLGARPTFYMASVEELGAFLARR